MIPACRRFDENDAPVNPSGDFVLYWMIAARRAAHNFALDHATDRARELGKPLVVLEPLRADHPWACQRFAAFVHQGMQDNQRAFAKTPVTYLPFIEPERGAGKGLLEALAQRACLVVTDKYPAFFLPRMVAAAAEKLAVRLESVDGNGLMPLAETPREFTTAYSFRRFLQKSLPDHLADMPRPAPALDGLKPLRRGALDEITARWPTASQLDDPLRAFPDAPPPSPIPGGAAAGAERLADFIDEDLGRYGEGRNHPDDAAQSGLSPWLHFGHVGAHQAVRAVLEAESWGPDNLSGQTSGKRSGFWGLSEGAESFLDELVTWRELGHVFCHHRPDYADFDSLPDWARKTLAEHAGDARPYLYTLDEFERAATHDEIWNAAQRQLVVEGRIHNYLRMLWGKKILHWTRTPREALDVMVELNNKYALDGRDPNSYSGIFWTLGRFDRAWGPKREVFGAVRYMTSDSTKRKLKLTGYLERWSPSALQQPSLF